MSTLSDSGDISIESNGFQRSLQVLSTSPIKSQSSTKTLRRKRSSANAALTSRPSLLNLRGDNRVQILNKAQMSPTSNKMFHANLLGLTSNLDESMNLPESMTTLTIGNDHFSDTSAFKSESVFSSSATDSETSATFSDGSMSRRQSWDVEEENGCNLPINESIERNRLILAHIITTYDQNDIIQSEIFGHALITPNILITSNAQITPIHDLNKWTSLRATVEQSRIVAMCGDERKRTFEMETERTISSTKYISTFYLQSDMNACDGEEVGQSGGRLLKIIVHGLGKFNEARMETLPEQLSALIRQSSEIEEYSRADQHVKVNTGDAQIISKILRLVAENDV